MNTETKTFAAKGTATAGGSLVATFSTFNQVDHDGDVTLSTAIDDGQPVVLGSYGHGTHSGAQLPIGKGVIRNDGTRAQVAASIFDTQDAKDEFAIIKGLGDLCEWSYTLRPTEVSFDAGELAQYGPTARRILQKVDVIEVCAVLRGAGIGTHTESAKGHLVRIPQELLDRLREVRKPALWHFDSTVIDDFHHRRAVRFFGEE